MTKFTILSNQTKKPCGKLELRWGNTGLLLDLRAGAATKHVNGNQRQLETIMAVLQEYLTELGYGLKESMDNAADKSLGNLDGNEH